MNAVVSVIAQESRPMLGWRDDGGEPINADVILTSDGRAYVPFAFLCRALGIKNVREFRQRALDHVVLSHLLLQLPIETAGGRQLAWCLERRGVGFWLGSLNVARLRPEVQPRLLEFQEQLVDLADRLLHGEVEVTPMQALAEVNRLKSQQADALAWVFSLERRIGSLEHVVFAPEQEED